jgi:hypothetical protein
LCRNLNQSKGGRTTRKTRTAIGKEEEGLVVTIIKMRNDDRTANGSAKLILLLRKPLDGIVVLCQPVCSVKSAIANVFVDGAVQWLSS